LTDSTPPSAVPRGLQPLRRKLPLLISALLVLVVGANMWLAYSRVHDALQDAAGERLASVASQIAGMLTQSARGFRGELRTVAADRGVRAALADPSPAAVNAAMPALGTRIGTGTRTASRALWAPDCRLVAAVGPLSGRACPREAVPAAGRVGAFRQVGDSAVFDVTAPVVGDGGTVLGHVVETRRITGSGAAPVGRLVGAGGRVVIGDPDGTYWTDMHLPAAGPAAVPPRGRLATGRDTAGASVFQIAADVPGTDWVVLVEMPHATADAPLRNLLATLIAAALGCIALGAIGAYFISRHVTAPLTEIEEAAEDIAHGDYSRRVAVRRRDELGRLGTAFNTMAARVETARSLLDDMLACSPVGVAVFDTELRYVRVNGAMAALTGRSIREHIGQRAARVDPAMGEQIEPLLRSVLLAGVPIMNQRMSTVSEDGQQRYWVATTFPVRGADGEATGAGLLTLDTTAHQELEGRFLQAQKMDAVGRLAGGVAHDFNNLLTVILSYSVMAINALPRGTPLRNDLEEIRDAGERAAGLTKQLLAFSRNQVLQPRVVNVNGVAANMERMLRRLIGEDVRLVLDLAEGLHPVHADPGQLEQVIMNLVLNARDAMPTGGRLAVETENSTITAEISARTGTGAGEYVTLRVRDEGVGMSPEVQSHLFEPFFTTKEPGQGTGLGLATVYGIVKQSGGDIRVTSSPGAGTTVEIRLPRATDDAPAAADARAHGGTHGTETVLLVEDDAALQTLALRVLRQAGYNVLGAQSPETALEIGRTYAGRIDLLVTDVVMPGMHGGAVADEMARLRPGIRTLFISGYPDDEVLRRGVVTEPSAFLQKPFTPGELAQRVRAALDARPPRA
jgi:signal transduction histidine kinase/CheY-like chemotaxis protein